MFIILCVIFTTIHTIYCDDGNSLIAHFNLTIEDWYIKCSVAPEKLSFTENQTAELKVIYENGIKDITCKVGDENVESKFELRVHDPKKNGVTTFRKPVTKQLVGNWECTLRIYISHKLPANSNIKVENDNTTAAVCHLGVIVTDVSFCDNYKCVYIGVGVGILVLAIIAGQSACVIYFRRKARSLRRLESLSARPRDKNDKARYSENPKKKPLIPLEVQGRESIIYEALDNVRLPVPPEPPALDTLPRTPKPSKTSTDSASSPKTDTDSEPAKVEKPKEKTKAVTGSKKFSLPSLTLTKNQTEEKQRTFSVERPRVKPKPSENKRTTLDRIKERPPLPLPIPQSPDGPGEYEEMSTPPARNPEPIKPKFQKPPSPSTLKKALPNPKPQTKPVKPIVPTPVQNKLKKSLFPPKSDTVTELENVLKKNRKLNPTSPNRTLTKTTPKPTIPALPKPVVGVTKPTVASPMDAPVPPPISTLPRPKVSSPVEKVAPVAFKAPKPTPMNAPLPPPISTLPKAAIPTPEEPEAYANSSDEEWTYEPLEPYNIYSM